MSKPETGDSEFGTSKEESEYLGSGDWRFRRQVEDVRHRKGRNSSILKVVQVYRDEGRQEHVGVVVRLGCARPCDFRLGAVRSEKKFAEL